MTLRPVLVVKRAISFVRAVHRLPVLVALLLAACQDATVLTPDGSRVVTVCTSGDWTQCIAKACPDGYTVTEASDCKNCSAILRCKPAPARQDGGTAP